MSLDGYNQFCPVAKACEVLEPRWTLLILCEMWSGSTHFNEIRRGVPRMSPTLLSKRLKEMEAHGLILRSESRANGEICYTTTRKTDDLRPVVYALGKWAHRNIDADVTLEHLDARLLMRTVIQFTYPELPRPEQSYWVIAKPGNPVDLCAIDPGHNVDLYVTADLKAMTSAWMGLSDLFGEVSRGKISLIGNQNLAATISKWMVRGSYAAA
jgi:DNA-binding HxlR family transcriptional regulator